MTLDVLGIAPGHRVRFRRKADGRWTEGVAVCVEKDGSLGVRDGKGAARAIPMTMVEVRCVGRRGAPGWEPLLDRANRTEQLKLL